MADKQDLRKCVVIICTKTVPAFLLFPFQPPDRLGYQGCRSAAPTQSRRQDIDITILISSISALRTFHFSPCHSFAVSTLVHFSPSSKMLFFSWAALLVSGWCIAATTAAELEARYQHYVVTGTHTGVNQATGARPARRNILDLQEDAPSW